MRRHTVRLDILVLSLVVTVFWCMGSACRIYLHANFYISFCIKRLLWYMYCISPDRQGESESRSEWIYLFLCDCLCVSVSVCARVCLTVWQRVTHSRRNRGVRAKDSVYLLWYSFINSYVFCPILSAPLGLRENSSICDFKPHSSVPLAPWGKSIFILSFSVFLSPVVLFLWQWVMSDLWNKSTKCQSCKRKSEL